MTKNVFSKFLDKVAVVVIDFFSNEKVLINKKSGEVCDGEGSESDVNDHVPEPKPKRKRAPRTAAVKKAIVKKAKKTTD